MNTRLRSLALCALLACTLPNLACADKLVDVVDAPVPTKTDGSRFTADEVQAAIIEGCVGRKWVAKLVSPGVISASILVRNVHYAEVKIPFSEKSYSILYTDSRKLDYDQNSSGTRRSIHGNYNKWVAALNREIALKLSTHISAGR